MALNATQLATLKTNLIANAAVVQAGQPNAGAFVGTQVKDIPNTPDGNLCVASWYNLDAAPTYYVWRSVMPSMEVYRGGGFDWTRVDNLTVGKARILEWMTQSSTLVPASANIRDGVNACFAVAADANTRLSIFQQMQRPAKNAEKLLAVGTGTSTTNTGVGPATLTFEGNVTTVDIVNALNLP